MSFLFLRSVNCVLWMWNFRCTSKYLNYHHKHQTFNPFNVICQLYHCNPICSYWFEFDCHSCSCWWKRQCDECPLLRVLLNQIWFSEAWLLSKIESRFDSCFGSVKDRFRWRPSNPKIRFQCLWIDHQFRYSILVHRDGSTQSTDSSFPTIPL